MVQWFKEVVLYNKVQCLVSKYEDIMDDASIEYGIAIEFWMGGEFHYANFIFDSIKEQDERFENIGEAEVEAVYLSAAGQFN